jgi:hypothetical protein
METKKEQFKRAIAKACSTLDKRLKHHESELQELYCKVGKKAGVVVNLGLKFVDNKGDIQLEISLGFIKSKLNEKTVEIVSAQGDLPGVQKKTG